MALKIKNFTLPDGLVLDEAYVRVHSIVLSNIDYEYLEPIPDSDDLITKWVTRLELRGNVYVYGDKVARDNRVSPMNWFDFVFQPEGSEVDAFKTAYEYVKELYPTAEDC